MFTVSESVRKRMHLPIHLTFAFLVSAYFFSYFFRVSASVVLPKLSSEWGMSAALTGFISSLYFYAYALMQPIGGALNDKYGPTRIVSLGIAISGLGALLFAFGNTPLTIAFGRLLTGLGLAPMLSGALVYQSAAFPSHRYAFYSGLTYTIGNLGAVSSVAPLGAALDSWGRFSVFLGLAGINLILALIILTMRENDPVVREKKNEQSSIRQLWLQLQTAFRTIARSRQLRAMSIIWATSFGSLMALQGLWAVSWLETAYQVTSSEARFWATMIGVGVMAGNFFGGQLAPFPAQRRKAITISSLFYASTYSFLWISIAFHWPLWLTGWAGFFLGAMAGVNYTHLTAGVNDLAAQGQGGSLFGAMNLLTFSGVILFQWGTGALLSHFSSPAPGAFTAEGYLRVFALVIVVVITSCSVLTKFEQFPSQIDTASHALVK